MLRRSEGGERFLVLAYILICNIGHAVGEAKAMGVVDFLMMARFGYSRSSFFQGKPSALLSPRREITPDPFKNNDVGMGLQGRPEVSSNSALHSGFISVE